MKRSTQENRNQNEQTIDSPPFKHIKLGVSGGWVTSVQRAEPLLALTNLTNPNGLKSQQICFTQFISEKTINQKVITIRFPRIKIYL